MSITLESALAVAGIADWEAIQVLRDGFPSLVVRVPTSAFDGRQSIILKACPVSSREPDVLACLHRNGLPVPAVLDVREGYGFRVIVMEDVGADALHKHPDAEWYKAAVREIAKIHRQFRLSCLTGGSRAALTDLVPTYDDAKWAAVVWEGLQGTLRRIDDGTYATCGTLRACGVVPKRGREDLSGVLGDLAQKTLAMIEDPSAYRPFPNVLVHGDYHDGNVLIRTPRPGEVAVPALPNPFAIVDWDSARWDSGFFDLVSLFDVSERMGTFYLDPEEIICIYLEAYADIHSDASAGIYSDTPADAYQHTYEDPHQATHQLETHPDGPTVCSAEAEWRRCRVLRAWGELKWFSETGEDFGDRIGREIRIIQTHLR
ncbi:MAG: phosphotransferase family protein [Bacillota bacterium]